MSKQYPKISVSIPDEQLIELAREKAKQQRRSVSNYIAGLIEADLASALRDAPVASSTKGQEVGSDKVKQTVYNLRRTRKPSPAS